MQEAGITAALKILISIVAIYYIVKFLARLFLPVLAKKMVDKAQQQFQQQYQNRQNNHNQNTATPNSNLKSDKPREKNKVGEYIDYEEID